MPMVYMLQYFYFGVTFFVVICVQPPYAQFMMARTVVCKELVFMYTIRDDVGAPCHLHKVARDYSSANVS